MIKRNLVRRLEELEEGTAVCGKQINLQIVMVSPDGTRENGPLYVVRIPPVAPRRRTRWR